MSREQHWKQFGGRKQLPLTNNLSLHALVAENLSLTNGQIWKFLNGRRLKLK